MTLKKNLKNKKAQVTIEYFIVFLVITLAIIASGFFGNINRIFERHFTQVRTQILN